MTSLLQPDQFCISIKVLTLVSLLTFCNTQKTYSQDNKNYEYLIKCSNTGNPDSSDIEVKGFGMVNSISISYDIEETGLTYYNVPAKSQKKSPSKQAEIAAANQMETWKNNSRIVRKDKKDLEGICIIDLRMRLVIENIYLQVIIISDHGRMYEIMCFRDKNDENHFDSLTRKVLEKNCLN
jgi:hypothetical protein